MSELDMGKQQAPPIRLRHCGITDRERTIQARTDTIRYKYSSIHNGRYRYRYEYFVRWCPSHLLY